MTKVEMTYIATVANPPTQDSEGKKRKPASAHPVGKVLKNSDSQLS